MKVLKLILVLITMGVAIPFALVGFIYQMIVIGFEGGKDFFNDFCDQLDEDIKSPRNV